MEQRDSCFKPKGHFFILERSILLWFFRGRKYKNKTMFSFCLKDSCHFSWQKKKKDYSEFSCRNWSMIQKKWLEVYVKYLCPYYKIKNHREENIFQFLKMIYIANCKTLVNTWNLVCINVTLCSILFFKKSSSGGLNVIKCSEKRVWKTHIKPSWGNWVLNIKGK